MNTHSDSNNFVNEMFGFYSQDQDQEDMMIDMNDPDIVTALECLSLNDGEYMDEDEIHVVTDDEVTDDEVTDDEVTDDEDNEEEEIFITPIYYTFTPNQNILNTPPRITRRNLRNGRNMSNLQPVNLFTHMQEEDITPARPVTFRHMQPSHPPPPPPPPAHFLNPVPRSNYPVYTINNGGGQNDVFLHTVFQ